MDDPASDCPDGAYEGIATFTKLYNFIRDAVLLGGERERSRRGTEEFSVGGQLEVESHFTNKQLDIVKAKRSGIGGCFVSVFARAEQEEECDDDHITYSSEEKRMWWKMLRNICDPTNDPDRDGFNPSWRRVLLFPCRLHTRDPKVSLLGFIQARVRGPHGEERLGNCP